MVVSWARIEGGARVYWPAEDVVIGEQNHSGSFISSVTVLQRIAKWNDDRRVLDVDSASQYRISCMHPHLVPRSQLDEVSRRSLPVSVLS